MSWRATATPDSFVSRYEENLSKTRTYQDAYEMTENEHEKDFGCRRYSDYNSFRYVRTRLMKKCK